MIKEQSYPQLKFLLESFNKEIYQIRHKHLTQLVNRYHLYTGNSIHPLQYFQRI